MVEVERSRIIFMGTPEFAAIVLRRLLEWPGGEIVGVFCGPDKKSGRGLKLIPSAVKQTAERFDLPLYQPPTLKTGEIQNVIKNLAPHFIAVASYGLILPQAVLDAASIAPLNVHASLLPAYRGAAPIQRAIMENYGPGAETGVGIMKMEAGLDTGPVYLEKRIPINGKYHAQLSTELAQAGAEALVETMSLLKQGKIEPVPQNDSLATYAHKLEKSDGFLDWNKPALEVDAKIRAVTSWPGALATLQIENASIPVTITGGHVAGPAQNVPAGSIERRKSGLAIACSDNWYEVETLRPQGRKEMRAADFANGYCKVKTGLCGRAKSQ